MQYLGQLLWLFFHWCDNFKSDKQLSNCLPKVIQYYHTITLVFLFLTIFVFLGLVVTITCYFVFIPINKSISDAPNRVVSIYQSGGFIVGSIIVYKILEFFYIKKKKEITIEDIHKILQDRLPCPVQQPEKSQKSPEDDTSQKLSKGQRPAEGRGAGMPPKHSTQQGEHGLQKVPQQPSIPLSDFSEDASKERTEAEISTC